MSNDLYLQQVMNEQQLTNNDWFAACEKWHRAIFN